MSEGSVAAALEFRLLGPLEVVSGGESLPLGGARQSATLALLLLHANEPVPRERLVDGLWGERPPETATNALQVAVHGLRRLLGRERLETRGAAYLLRVEPGELDLQRFETFLARAREAADPAAAARLLRDALKLWRGPALADLRELPFAATEAGRLDDLRLATVEQRLQAELDGGAGAELVPELRALVAEHPYRERLHRHLMLALYRGGRQAEALEAYGAARRLLVEELGVEPGAELQELERAILRHDPALAPPARGGRPALPAPARPLIGRHLELAAVTSLLRRPDVRLLTLTGPGGTGKTRLALEAAHELAREHRDGAFLVDLAPVRDPALVLSALARALGVVETAEGLEAELAGALVRRELLLFVDNFEQVVEAAPALGRLLAAAPQVTALVTSRAPLRIGPEHVYAVPPLALPNQDDEPDELARNEAVRLFAERAAAVAPGFELTETNVADVAEICRALDGLPLAVELAAARADVLSPRELLARLEQPLELLRSGPRDAPARQRTLRRTIEWSHDLLDPRAQELFARLSVFAGGFDLAAAEAVCGAGVDDLGALAAQSLLRAGVGAKDDRRFALLETIREYALERLRAAGDAEAVARSHCEHYLAVAEEAAPRVFFEQELLERLEHEHGNLRAALAWARDADAELYLRLATSLWRFWYLRAFFREGRGHLEEALARGTAAAPAARADGAKAAAILAIESGAPEAGRPHADAALELYRALGDERGVLTTLTVLGNAARRLGVSDDARRHFAESTEIAERLGLVEDVAVGYSNLAAVATDEHDYEGASPLIRRAIAVYRDIGRTDTLALGLGTLAYVELGRGDTTAAAAAAVEGAELARRVGFREALTSALLLLAAATADAEPERAAELLGTVEAVAASPGEELEVRYRELRQETATALRERLGAHAFDAAQRAGRERPLDELPLAPFERREGAGAEPTS